MDFNIDTWSIERLKDVFDIEQELNIEIIDIKIKDYINRANELYTNEERDLVIKFVNEAATKMYNFCDSKNFNIKQNNYRIKQNDFNIKQDEFTIADIDHKTPRLETFNLNYKKGILNPLKKQTRILNVNINSIFRKNYYKTQSSNFTYNFPNSIKNAVSMRVATVEFANTVYLYSAKNRDNEFTIITYDNSGGEIINIDKHIIQVPDGMYALDSIIKFLNKAIFSKSIPLKRVAVTFDDRSGTLNFVRNKSVSNGGIADPTNPNYKYLFDIDFRLSDNKDRPIQLNMGWVLGYRKPYYKYSEDYVTPSKMKIITQEGYNPEAPINMLGSPYFLLHINDYNNNSSPVFETLFQEGTITSSHIMDKIPNTGSKTIIQTNLGHNIDKIRRYYGPVNIEKIEIKLFDQFGRIIDLKKSDFSLTLQFEILYNL